MHRFQEQQLQTLGLSPYISRNVTDSFIHIRPYGIVFGSCGFAEEVLVQIAYAFEKATRVRLRAPSYPEAIAKSQISDVRQQTK